MQETNTPHIEDTNSAATKGKQRSKRTRRVPKIIIGLLAVLTLALLLFGAAIAVLHLKSVQTYIIGKVTDRLEETLQANISIAQFHYRPLSHIAIDSVYLSDQQYDTLAYIEQIQLEFQPLEFLDDKIDIQLLRMQAPYINLQSTSDSTLNIQFLLDAFKQDTVSFPFQLNIDTLKLEHSRIRYNEVLVDELSIDLALPIFSSDSLDVQLHGMHLRAQLDYIDAYFEADLHGSLDSIYAQNMQLIFRGEQLFSGNLAVVEPTKLEALYIQADNTDLFCNGALLQNLLQQLSVQSFSLPPIITQLGNVHYHGNIHGWLDSLSLKGAFNTSLGSIRVEGYLNSDTTLQNFYMSGDMHTRSFQLGRLLNQPDLGNISLDAHVTGKFEEKQFIAAKTKASILQFEYKNYAYQNIQIEGDIAPKEIKGKLNIQDKNIQLDITNGLVDWSEEETRLWLNMMLSDFKPATLNLIQQYPDLTLGASIDIHLYTSGKIHEMLDNMTGYVSVDTLQIINGEQQTTMQQFELTIEDNSSDGTYSHIMDIQSDYLTANVNGSFLYSTLPTTIQQILHTHIPNIVEKPTSIFTNNHVDMQATIRNFAPITQVLELGIDLPDSFNIYGHIYEDKQELELQTYIPYIRTNGTNMEDINIALNNHNNQLGLSLSVLNHLPKDNPTAAKLGDIKAAIQLCANNNALDLLINLENTDKVRNEGVIHATSLLSKNNDTVQLDIEVQPTHFVLNDSAWNISKANIMYIPAKKIMDVHNFALRTDYQSISINGRASTSDTDSLSVALHNINMDYLLSYTEANKAISIMGPATGEAHIYSIFSAPMLEAQAQIPNGGLNGVYLGDVTAEAKLDKENKIILIDGQIVDSTNHLVAQVAGKVIPQDKWWGLDITCDSVDIHFIDAWTNGIIANPQGRAYGRVKVEGQEQLVWVTGRALAKNAQVTVPQIGTTFYLTDSIFLDSTAIQFPNITMYDQYGNQGSFSGHVWHENFLDITYDLKAQANNMMVMNLPADQQSLFYGQVYGTGDVHIHGDEINCYIDVNAKTEAKTKFYLNVNSASKATSSNFINFVQPSKEAQKPEDSSLSTNNQSTSTPKTYLRLSLQGEVTPEADINIKLGADDGIKGRGEGNLKLVYEDPSEHIQMQGDYTLQSGKFDFSIGNIVRRNFTIREGSKITWTSDPLTPVMDIFGVYNTSASLRDLFGSESDQIATDRTSVPVNCVLHMTGELFNPVLNFAIELPQSDESVQSQIKSIINTEEMLMRQVIYILAFNRFYTPDYLQNTQNIGLNETYSILSSTITGQINSWLSKLTDVFTMGFNFRTDGEGETASQEYEANFQIHPIRQLIINGNFGYRYNDISNRPFFGDLDIEYLLTENGKLRAKAFTHTVDKYSLRQANTVQGVGFVFKHDFDWDDKPAKKAKKKEATKKVKRKNKEQTVED